jgi:two-component system LytT family response regulator
MLRTLIIDDEPLACRHLRKLIEREPHLTLAGEAGTFDQARGRLAAGDYDLVLLDIQLRGGNGFDLVPDVRAGARIIFVTAFDQHALRAFDVNALDYLLKPVTAERLASSVSRLQQTATVAAGDSVPAAPLKADDTVFIQTDTVARFVPLAQISAVLSNENYSDVHLRTGERLFTRRTMKIWEEMLPGAHFTRIHRCAIVNLVCVEQCVRDARDSAVAHITGVRTPVDVSRRYVTDLEARLKASPKA